MAALVDDAAAAAAAVEDPGPSNRFAGCSVQDLMPLYYGVSAMCFNSCTGRQPDRFCMQHRPAL
jgi:hypothetical protein